MQETNNHSFHLINVKNGLLDLTSMTLLPHESQSSTAVSSMPKLSKLPKLNVNYNPTATCPVFDKFLDDVCRVNSKFANKIAANIIAPITADTVDTATITADTVTTESRKQFLLEFMGAIFSNYSASKFNKQVLFLFGPNDTGKTQIKRLVEEMLGYDNFSILGANCPISKMKKTLRRCIHK